MELHKDCPLAFENVRALCTGEVSDPKTGKPLSYRGTEFATATNEYVIGGDLRGTGVKARSIFGGAFASERPGLERKFEKKGAFALFSPRADENDARFLITLQDHLRW